MFGWIGTHISSKITWRCLLVVSLFSILYNMSMASGGGETRNDVQIHEEYIIQLRRSRSAAKANITKKIKELTE